VSVLVATDLVATRGGRVVLAGVSCELARGDLLAVTGHSGVGKTTLLHALGGVEPPDSGSVRLGDMAVGERTRTRIALVPQQHGLLALLTAAENVELALQAAGRPRAEVRDRAEAALLAVGLGRRTEHLVDELSGGEQQRVAVARALAVEPEVLLADEPTAELDAENRARVLDALHRAALTGTAVVVTTHDEEAAALCRRRLHLQNGRLVAHP
jgi:putative ABC transport system ATP-binding protein